VHGYVIDFLHLYYETYDWPAFNIADSVIFIGAALLILDMFINNDAESTEPKETKETKND
jgi:signal peptidase II